MVGLQGSVRWLCVLARCNGDKEADVYLVPSCENSTSLFRRGHHLHKVF